MTATDIQLSPEFDRTILTAQEHKLMGSNPWGGKAEGTTLAKAMERPFLPIKLLEVEITPAAIAEVARLRAEQGEFNIFSGAGRFYGFEEDSYDEPIIALSPLDPDSGEATDHELRLSGIQPFTLEGRKLIRGEVVRDPGVLEKYRLTPEGRKLFFLGDEVSGSPEGEKGVY